jgi:hypothetical protein
MGPMILALLTIGIVKRGAGWMTPFDIGFLVVLLMIIVARRVEFREGDPRTAFGEPATAVHLRNFAWGTFFVGIAVFAVANVLGNHVISN